MRTTSGNALAYEYEFSLKEAAILIRPSPELVIGLGVAWLR